MSLDPITAVVDAGKTILNKFVRDKMSEKDLKELEMNFELEMMRESRKEGSSFRDFVVQYEGAAKDVPQLIQILRAAIRPCFTILVGYLDWLFFTAASTYTPEQVSLLKAINIIVLAFWFGEKAIAKSGILSALKKS